MYEALADIEALALTCHSEQSKEYISEAIKCYRAGAYRTAIVSTWIAVVFDLVDKVRELALFGEAAAVAIDAQYQQYNAQIQANNNQGIKGALEFERGILDTTNNQLQFFDRQQFIELKRLQEDRHRCAHPSFQQLGIPFAPSAELARVHIRNAIVYVLSQPPVQGRSALARLEVVVASAYFPKTAQEAISQLQSNGLRRPTDSLVNAFVDKLLFGYVDPQSALFAKQTALTALQATHTLFTGITSTRIATSLNKIIRLAGDAQLSIVALLAGVITSYAGDSLDQASKDKLGVFIDTSASILEIAELQNVNGLSARVAARVNTLNIDSLATLALIQTNHALVKERGLSLLSQGMNWNSVNDIFNRAILPIFDILTVDDISRIVHMPAETGADIRGSNGFYLLANNVASSGMMTYAELNQLLRDNNFTPIVPPPPPPV